MAFSLLESYANNRDSFICVPGNPDSCSFLGYSVPCSPAKFELLHFFSATASSFTLSHWAASIGPHQASQRRNGIHPYGILPGGT